MCIRDSIARDAVKIQKYKKGGKNLKRRNKEPLEAFSGSKNVCHLQEFNWGCMSGWARPGTSKNEMSFIFWGARSVSVSHATSVKIIFLRIFFWVSYIWNRIWFWNQACFNCPTTIIICNFFFLDELRIFTISDFPKQTHFGHTLITLFFSFTFIDPLFDIAIQPMA